MELKGAGKKKENVLKPHPCAHGSTMHAPASDYCSKGGIPLTEKEPMPVTDSADKIRQLFKETPHAQSVFIEYFHQVKR